MKRIVLTLFVALAAGLFCSAANSQKTAPAAQTAAPQANGKAEICNNAASLLFQLLNQDKDVGKILIIKHVSEDQKRLIDTISHTADDGAKQLEALAKKNPSLDLHVTQLPPAEIATRAAVGDTKKHELLSSSGTTFAFNLLLTQTDALSYGAHLARIAAENSSQPDEQREFHSLDVSLSGLFEQVVAAMRAIPRK